MAAYQIAIQIKIYKRNNGRTTDFKSMRVSKRTRCRHDIAITENVLNSNSLCCFVARIRTYDKFSYYSTHTRRRPISFECMNQFTYSQLSFYLWPLSMGAAHSLIERHCVYNWYLSSSSSPPPSFIVRSRGRVTRWGAHTKRALPFPDLFVTIFHSANP